MEKIIVGLVFIVAFLFWGYKLYRYLIKGEIMPCCCRDRCPCEGRCRSTIT